MLDLYIDLQKFADGGDGGGAAAPSGGETGVSAPDAVAQPQRRRKENPLANVKYGKQQEDAPNRVATDAEQTANIEGTGKKSFDELIRGEYKDDFGRKMQEIIQQRFKNNRESEDRLGRMAPIMELLGRKFGLDPTDIDGISKRVSDDDSLYEEEAMERGMSVESLKTIKAMERENAQLKAREQQSIADQQLRQHFNNLAQQADALKQLYPGFDLQAEMANPVFARLTAPGNNVDVRTAYEVVHREEMRGAEMQFAAQKSAERMAKAVQSGSRRPAENGLNSQQSASVVKTDPRTFTRDDRAEIRRRVALGEKIVL